MTNRGPVSHQIAPVMKMRPTRLLHRGHFAFMRALAQGIDVDASWDRYLAVDGERTDLRLVRRTTRWLRGELSGIARREGRPGTARLLQIDGTNIRQETTQPSLAEFAEEQGLEDFSETEQIEAYKKAYGQTTGQRSRKKKLIERQVAAINWIEGLAAQEPRAGDKVSEWLSPNIASRLELAGMPTVFSLAQRVNGIGARWWNAVPGIGALKGSRIVEWLHEYEGSTGIHIGAHVFKPFHHLAPQTLTNVVAPDTAIVPLEKFVVPSDLDGSAGRFRAPPEQCLLESSNDYAAIQAWLSIKRPLNDGRLSPTQRSYRKEAERLLLWAILERRKALSSLSTEDATAFRDFLLNPPPAWCGPRYRQRWSPLWRPLEGPLSSAALGQSITILRTLFAFLMAQNYVVGNPFAGIAQITRTARTLGSNRTLSFAEMDAIEAELKLCAATETGRRLARAVRWLYATGLRLSEIIHARCGDLQRLDYTDAHGQRVSGWTLNVIGKGQKERQVPAPAILVVEISTELQAHGRPLDLLDSSNAEVPLLARYSEQGDPLSWSASGLSKSIKALMQQVSIKRTNSDAQRLRRASAHWLRHSHGSHALQGRPGHAPVPLQVVRNNLGHASIGTTSGYLTTEMEERLRAMDVFWNGSN